MVSGANLKKVDKTLLFYSFHENIEIMKGVFFERLVSLRSLVYSLERGGDSFVVPATGLRASRYVVDSK